MAGGNSQQPDNDAGAVAIDGILVDPKKATVSVFDRGFLYGDSVFETLRTYGREPFKLLEHTERLAWSAERLGITLPLTIGDFAGEIGALLRHASSVDPRLASGELVVRVMLSRGVGPLGLDPTLAIHPTRIAFIRPFRPLPAKSYENGVKAICFRTYRPSDTCRGAKVGNYLESIIAIRAAHEQGAEEAFIVSHNGEVVEGTTSNIFAIKGSKLLTPSLDGMVLPGITRALVLARAPDVGLDPVECQLFPEDFASADEVFITSTLREILPISTLDGYVIGNGRPGSATRALHQCMRERDGFTLGASGLEVANLPAT